MISDAKLQEAIKWFPHAGQKSVLNCQEREIVICAGRRWGKSAVCGYIIVKKFLQYLSEIRAGERASCKIWIVAPTYELTGKVFEYVTRFFLAFDKSMGQYISGGQGRPYMLKISESIWIQCKSTTEPMSLLGEELDLEVIDEAARIPAKIYDQYIYPTTIAKSRNTQVILISTPRGKTWFQDLFHILAEKKAAFKFTTADGVETDPVKLEEIRKKTPDLVFRQEYLAEFVDEAGTVFRDLDSKIVPFKRQEGLREKYYVIGVDLGRMDDHTVITVIDRDTHEIVSWDRFKGIDYPLQKLFIRGKAFNYNKARVIIDATGVGRPIYEDLRQEGVFVEDFTFSGKSKQELIGRLIVAVDERYIRVPDIPDLVAEMKAFQYNYINESTGELLKNPTYSAPVGFHDDGVISLALAVWGINLSRAKPTDALSKELAKVPKNNKRIISFI